MTDRELMQQALDALNLELPTGAYLELKNALRDRLAQPEQESVAVVSVLPLRGDESIPKTIIDWKNGNPVAGPLYTTPPQRKPLDETTVFFLADKYLYEGGKNYGILEFARAIESRHGIES